MIHDELILPRGVTRRVASEFATEAVEALAAAVTNTKIYWAGHPRVRHSIDEFLLSLVELCDVTGETEHDFGFGREHVVFRERALLGAGFAAARLIETFRGRGVHGLRLARRAKAEDVATLLEILDECEDGHIEELARLLRERRPRTGVELLAERRGGAGTELDFVSRLPISLYQSVVRLLESITVTVSTGGAIDFGPVRAQAEDMLDQLQRGEAGILQLARQEQYDAFTFAHSVRVSALALNFGRHLTDDARALIQLGTAALLHDVGKTRVPFELLQTRRPLTADERYEISKHAEYGTEILIDHVDCEACALAACYGHHVTADHRGYPRSEHEHFTSAVTRIVAIADVYEALTAERPYKRAMSPARAFRIMMDQGDRFDRRLLRRFIEVNGIWPSGQLVALSDGRIARVERQGPRPDAPIVRLERDRVGEPLHAEDRVELDLSAPGEGPHVVRAELLQRPMRAWMPCVLCRANCTGST